MKVLCDDRGFVLSFAFIGDLVGGQEVPDPEDLELFMQRFYSFRMADGNLEYDHNKYEEEQQEELKAEYRRRRETECFSIVNRGQLWYEGITITRLIELRAWYKAWLDVTETMVIPTKPAWLE